MSKVAVSSMKLEIRDEDDVTVIAPVGSLVIGSPEDTMNRAFTNLFADGRKRFVIDLGEVKKIDSSGIESLLTACQRARENGGDLKLARVAPLANVRDRLDCHGHDGCRCRSRTAR